MALLAKRVLLIGMDIRNPQLGSYLNIRSPERIDQLFGRYECVYLRHYAFSAIQKGMDVILAGPVPPNPSELLLSNRVDELFGQLREIYDYIIIDSAPVSMVARYIQPYPYRRYHRVCMSCQLHQERIHTLCQPYCS